MSLADKHSILGAVRAALATTSGDDARELCAGLRAEIAAAESVDDADSPPLTFSTLLPELIVRVLSHLPTTQLVGMSCVAKLFTSDPSTPGAASGAASVVRRTLIEQALRSRNDAEDLTSFVPLALQRNDRQLAVASWARELNAAEALQRRVLHEGAYDFVCTTTDHSGLNLYRSAGSIRLDPDGTCHGHSIEIDPEGTFYPCMLSGRWRAGAEHAGANAWPPEAPPEGAQPAELSYTYIYGSTCYEYRMTAACFVGANREGLDPERLFSGVEDDLEDVDALFPRERAATRCFGAQLWVSGSWDNTSSDNPVEHGVVRLMKLWRACETGSVGRAPGVSSR